jgi:hypothetical protein
VLRSSENYSRVDPKKQASRRLSKYKSLIFFSRPKDQKPADFVKNQGFSRLDYSYSGLKNRPNPSLNLILILIITTSGKRKQATRWWWAAACCKPAASCCLVVVLLLVASSLVLPGRAAEL